MALSEAEHRFFDEIIGLLVLDLEWVLVTSNPANNFFELLKTDLENWQNIRKFCTVALNQGGSTLMALPELLFLPPPPPLVRVS